MTLRRLFVLLQGLPWDSPFKVEVRAAFEAAQKPTPDKIRSRAAEWEARNAARRQKEVAS